MKKKDLEKLILRWQGPIYNHAYRMLGREAEASDATQEIFARVLKSLDRYDPARDFKPWIYQVATHVLYNFIRDSKLRKEKEKRAAMKQEPTIPGDGQERKEFEAIVQAQVSRLPEENRSLLVLHYYQGLSQHEVAEALSLPRTTVQSRIKKSLDLLKKGLAGSGYMAVLPHVESTMQAAAPLAVPAQLSSSLLGMAGAAAASGSATGVALGGALMTKKMIGVATIVGLVSLGAGMMAGDVLFSGSGETPKANPHSVSQEEYSTLTAENKKLLGEIAQLREENQRLAEANKVRRALESPATDGMGKTKEIAQPEEADDADSGIKIDWDQFGEKLAALATIDKLVEAGKNGESYQPTPEEEGLMMEFFTEFMKVTQQAHKISAHPFFDEKIFPDFATSIFGKTLGLSEEQSKAFTDQNLRLLRESTAGVDLDGALPAEKWRIRQNLIAGMEGNLASVLNPHQKAKLDNWGGMADGFLQGDRSRVEMGIDGLDGERQSQLIGRWQKAFDLEDTQLEDVKPVAASFVQEGKVLLEKYGMTSAEDRPRNLPDKERRLFARDYLNLQIRMEKQFQHILTPAQRKRLVNRMPVIFQLVPGGGTSVNTNNGPGF